MYANSFGGRNGRRLPAVAATLCLALLAFAAPATAAPSWLPATNLSAPLRDATNADVAMDSAGETVAIWQRQSPVNTQLNVQFSSRAPGQAFSPPTDLALGGSEPDVAITPGGEAVAVWKQFVNPPGISVIEAARRPPGGSFGAPVEVARLLQSVIPHDLQVAVNAAGDAVVVWTGQAREFEPDPTQPIVEASVQAAGAAFSPPALVSSPPAEEQQADSPQAGIDAGGDVTVVFQYGKGAEDVIQAATRPAGGAFEAPLQLSESGESAFSPGVAIDPAGNAVAIWSRSNGTNSEVQTSTRPIGGEFSAPLSISPPGVSAFDPEIAIAGSGLATAVWTASELTGVVEASSRPPGGGFSAPQTVTAVGEAGEFTHLAMNAAGDAVVAWSGVSGAEQVVRAAVQTAGGGFGAPTTISAPGAGFFHPSVALDGAGDATVVWNHEISGDEIVQAAGYDVGPPQLLDLAIPAQGVVGVPVSFSVRPFDVWGTSGTAFAFGDGSGQAGTSVTHAYTAPGSYRVAVQTTGAGGGTASSSATIAIVASNTFKLGKLKRNRKRGTATLPVTVPGPGKVAVAGKMLKKASKRAKLAGTVKLTLAAKGKALKQLNRTGKAKVKVKVTFSPDGGSAAAHTAVFKLIKKL